MVMFPEPYLLFLGNEASTPHAKTAFGLRDSVSLGPRADRGAGGGT